jgi:hypothetical protein
MVTPRALEPGEAELRIPARDEVLELMLDVAGERPIFLPERRGQRGEPLRDDAVEQVMAASSELDPERHEGPPPAGPVPGRSRALARSPPIRVSGSPTPYRRAGVVYHWPRHPRPRARNAKGQPFHHEPRGSMEIAGGRVEHLRLVEP